MRAFDIDKYISKQTKEILKNVRKYDKLYFEFVGKLFDDFHATRVLPGFESDSKLKLFCNLKEYAELIICINSENIQNERIRSDYDTLYIDDCIKLIQKYREIGFYVSGVALTVFNKQEKAIKFVEKLKNMGENVYFLNYIPNYPNDFEAILKSFKENDYIVTTRPLVIMTSSGSASGKLSASLSQLYKEYERGNKVGYAKYDLFPVWNLSVNHPLNVAFEASTADSGDEILVDKFYYEKYSKEVSNYNRDMKLFPTIRKILKITTGEEVYASPTEMVINTMRDAIVDDEIICLKAKEEIYRRYLTYWKQYLRGQSSFEPIKRVEYLMQKKYFGG